MKLTGQIILMHLKKYFHILNTVNIGASGKLQGPLLYEEKQNLEKGWCYIVPPGIMPEEAPETGTLLLFPGREESQEGFPQWEETSLIFLKEGSVTRLHNVLMKAFRFYEEWEEQLEEIQQKFGTVDEMLKVSFPVFENPLMVFRDDMTIKAVASPEPMEKKYPFFEAGREQMEMVNAMLQDAQFRRNRMIRSCYWGPDHITGFRSLNWNVIKNGATTYSLSVMEDTRPLTEADKDLLEILGSHIQFMLYSGEIAVGRKDESLQKILSSILSDRTLDYMEASRTLAECGWQREDSYLCLVFRLTYFDQNNLPVTSICNYMMEQFSGCCSFIFQEDIVNFFDLDLGALNRSQVETILKPFIRDSYLKAGYSRIVQGHMNIRRQYVQAVLALEVGMRKFPYQWIHHFNQIVFPYMMEQITRKLPAKMLCHEGVLKLSEHDREHGTQYLQTLRTYLDRHQNAVQSAKDLYIHRSTFLYRMEKIREILDSDLEDNEEILYLSLSLRLLEQEQ